MALSSRVKNKIMDVINTTFASIGDANGMRMPRSGNNLEPIAWNYMIAKHLLSLANKRKDEAEGACVAAGLLPDKEKNPQPPGKYGMVFSGEVVGITMDVRNSAPRVNAKVMGDYLVAHGVKRALVDEAAAVATTSVRPAHVFDPMILADVEFGK